MLPKQLARCVIVVPESFEKVKDFIYGTAKGGPEYCGNMKVYYHPYLGYIVSGFVKNQETEHSVECIPRIGDGQGLWHTHPSGVCAVRQVLTTILCVRMQRPRYTVLLREYHR